MLVTKLLLIGTLGAGWITPPSPSTFELPASPSLYYVQEDGYAEQAPLKRQTLEKDQEVWAYLGEDGYYYAAIGKIEVDLLDTEPAPEPVVTTSYAYSNGATTLTAQGGVYYFGGRKETYYSSRVLYHYRTGEWYADDQGFYRTSEGYYVVAASDMDKGTVFQCSKGYCQVLDCGCAEGTTDYYVNW